LASAREEQNALVHQKCPDRPRDVRLIVAEASVTESSYHRPWRTYHRPSRRLCTYLAYLSSALAEHFGKFEREIYAFGSAVARGTELMTISGLLQQKGTESMTIPS
jgi:hypothetical protein